ncbi:Cytosolic sulfotransferase 17 [Acorus calamus]|uniref:Sulfotransferase n=1 Tax=Acorus calamus TaxID=4465 RepID=A0AAV9DXX7_ACOCL|nr:Cytosolic sulfotransferase 17 [Acorus calamus]
MEEEVRGDEKIEQKYAHTISTLPKKKSWGQELHRYQGFWYFPVALDGVMSVQHNFKARPTDILLVSSPKSGTTWLKALTFAIVNRNVDDHTSNQVMHSSNPHEYVPHIEVVHLYTNNTITGLDAMPSPRILATHIPYSSLPKSTKDESGCRIVYISRDIKDVFVSDWHFFNNNNQPDSKEPFSLEEAFESYCDGVSAYGPIWDHQLEYWKASIERPQDVMFLRYEEMMEDPVNSVKRLAEFVAQPFSVEEEEGGVVEEIVKVCSFEYLKNLEVNKEGEFRCSNMKFKKQSFFRRGVVGDSRRCLTPEMIERLDKIAEMTMPSSGSNP